MISTNSFSLKKMTSTKETLSKKILIGRSNQEQITRNLTNETSSATLRSKTPAPVRSEVNLFQAQAYSAQNFNFKQSFGGNVKLYFFYDCEIHSCTIYIILCLSKEKYRIFLIEKNH